MEERREMVARRGIRERAMSVQLLESERLRESAKPGRRNGEVWTDKALVAK